MIRPTLFVGLGTTGVKILKYLRRLIYEEYERPGLPIFRYVGIETDSGEDGVDTELPNSNVAHENVRMVHATITNTGVIKEKLDPNNTRYKEQLKEWLLPDVLDIAGNQFTAGASGIRMAGRLCLWENWAKVTNELSTARNAIIAQGNINATRNILNDYFNRKGIDPPDEIIQTAPNIYIVGSLCGGTCGGMLIDIAYYMRMLLAVWGRSDTSIPSQIHGIFTMLDAGLANFPNNQTLAANCQAALREIDFFNHTASLYDVTFPDGTSVGARNDTPFEYMMIVSPTGKDPNISFASQSGHLDEEGLNQMVAMDIFGDVIGGSGENKNDIRTDWRSHPGYNSPKRDSSYTRGLGTFGLSAVWYPKYRIAGAAACSKCSKICNNWTRECRDTTPVETDARNAWDTILRNNISTLTTPTGQQPLKNQLDELMARVRNEFSNLFSSELEMALRNYPGNGTFTQRFSENGEYYELIKNQLHLFEDDVKEAIRAEIQQRISDMGFEGEYSLGDVNHFLQTLDEEIESYIQKCPQSPPRFNFNAINFSGMKHAENNRWTAAILWRQSAIKQQRERIFDQFETLVNDTYKELRNFLLKDALANLRKELGVGIQRTEEVFDSSRTIQQMLNQMIRKVNNCANAFEDDYNTLIRPINQLNVRILTSNENNDIQQDARRLEASIDSLDDAQKTAMYEGILKRGQNPISLSLFLNEEAEIIRTRLKEVFQREALRLIRSFNLVQEARRRLAGNLVDLASRANPYQNFNERYSPVTLQKLPYLICGSNRNGAIDELRDYLSQNNVHFVRVSDWPLEHLLFFYMEEAAFALDDLRAHGMLNRRYNENPGRYGHHTHRDPDKFNVEMFKRKTEIYRWMRAAEELLKEDIFQKSPRGLVFRYRTRTGLNRQILVENQQEVDDLARQQNRDGYAAFIRSAKQKFQELGYDEVVDRINITEKYDEDTDFYNGLLAELFPNEFARQEDDEYQEEVLEQADRATETVDKESPPTDVEGTSEEGVAQQGSTEAQQEQVSSSAQPSADDETQEVAAQQVQQETQQASVVQLQRVSASSGAGDEKQVEASNEEEENSNQQVQNREPTQSDTDKEKTELVVKTQNEQ